MNNKEKLSESLVASMLVKDFTKEISFQLANDTRKHPSNCLKKLSNIVSDNTIQQTML